MSWEHHRKRRKLNFKFLLALNMNLKRKGRRKLPLKVSLRMNLTKLQVWSLIIKLHGFKVGKLFNWRGEGLIYMKEGRKRLQIYPSLSTYTLLVPHCETLSKIFKLAKELQITSKMVPFHPNLNKISRV